MHSEGQDEHVEDMGGCKVQDRFSHASKKRPRKIAAKSLHAKTDLRGRMKGTGDKEPKGKRNADGEIEQGK